MLHSGEATFGWKEVTVVGSDKEGGVESGVQSGSDKTKEEDHGESQIEDDVREVIERNNVHEPCEGVHKGD